MTEVSSPNPTPAVQKQRPAANRLQSPTSPFFLGSNDDALERAQARAARAAALRRKSLSVNPHLVADDGEVGDPGLKKQQILELFQNCIKLASENVIFPPFLTCALVRFAWRSDFVVILSGAEN